MGGGDGCNIVTHVKKNYDLAKVTRKSLAKKINVEKNAKNEKKKKKFLNFKKSQKKSKNGRGKFKSRLSCFRGFSGVLSISRFKGVRGILPRKFLHIFVRRRGVNR